MTRLYLKFEFQVDGTKIFEIDLEDMPGSSLVSEVELSKISEKICILLVKNIFWGNDVEWLNLLVPTERCLVKEMVQDLRVKRDNERSTRGNVTPGLAVQEDVRWHALGLTVAGSSMK